MAAPNATHHNGLAAGASNFASYNITASTTGKVFAWQNPERVPVYVRDVVVEIVQQSSGACTLDIGTSTTDAVSDNLIDGISLAAAPAHTLYDNITDHGTNGTTRQYLAAGSYVTGYVASGDANGAQLNVSVSWDTISGGTLPFP